MKHLKKLRLMSGTGQSFTSPDTLPHMESRQDSGLEKAMRLFQQGLTGAAKDACAESLTRSTEFAPAHNLMGILEAQSGNPGAAARAFGRACELEPGNYTHHENLGKVRMQIQQVAQALNSFKRALEINPQSYISQTGLGCALIAQGRFEEALTVFTRAQSITKNDPALYLNLGTIFQQLGKTDEAITHFKKVFVHKPDSINAHACLGNMYLQKENFLAAEEHYSKAIELGAQRADIETGLARALEWLGKEEQAAAHHFTAVELNPQSQSAYIGLDMFLLQSGGKEKKQLIKELEKDHVYDDWTEALDKARALTSLYHYPQQDILATLYEFFRTYKPGDLHNQTWWRSQLAKFGNPEKGHDKVLRSVHSAIFSWSLPDGDTLAQIAEFNNGKRIHSYGSGTGYWERLLIENFDCNVIATDGFLRQRFLPMAIEDYSNTTISNKETIFLAWIPGGDTGILNILGQMCSGQKLVIIGEPPPQKGIQGICASPQVFANLEKEFSLKKCIPLATYSLVNDAVNLFVKL